MAHLEHMRPRLRKDALPHEFPQWRGSNGSSMPTPALCAISTQSHDPFRQICSDVGSPRSRDLFFNLASDIPATENSNFADDPTRFPIVLPLGNYLAAGTPKRIPFTDVSSSIPSLAKSGSNLSGHNRIPQRGRKERRQWGVTLGSQGGSATTMEAVRGFGASPGNNGGSPTSPVDPALYQNLVEMIPLMESFMDQQGGRTMFAHRASMVYTAAPPRISPYRKRSESPARPNKGLTPRRLHVKCEETREDNPVWEESENILRRVEEETHAEEYFPRCQSPRENTHELQMEIDELRQKLWEKDRLLNSTVLPLPAETDHLQSQIHELKQKLWEKDALLEAMANRPFQSTRQLLNEIEELKKQLSEKDSLLETTANQSSAEVACNKARRDMDVLRLQTQIETLQQELSERDRITQSACIDLSKKHHELGEMQSLLEQAEINMDKTICNAASMEAELNGLRCQVLTLRYQLDAVEASCTVDGAPQDEVEGPPYRVDMLSTIPEQVLVRVSGKNDEELVIAVPKEAKEDREKMDLVKRKYLAAVIAAREQPGEEALVMVAEFRRELQAYLTEPPLMDPFGVRCVQPPVAEGCPIY